MNNKLKNHCALCIINCALITSCTTPKTTTSHVINHRDSIHREHLTPHLIPPDSTTIDALLRCDSLGKVYISQINLLNEHNNTLSFQLDSLGRLKQTIIHRHDTLWLPHSDTKITEKTDFHAESHQIEYRTPPIITKILTIETLIIALALLRLSRQKAVKTIKNHTIHTKTIKNSKNRHHPLCEVVTLHRQKQTSALTNSFF